jgi:hypothetical protein
LRWAYRAVRRSVKSGGRGVISTIQMWGTSGCFLLHLWVHHGFNWALPPTLSYKLGQSIGGLTVGLVGGLLSGLVSGLLIGFLRTREVEIKPVEAIAWSWRTWPRDVMASLVIGLLCVFLIGLLGNPVGVSISSSTSFGVSGSISFCVLDGTCTPPLLERLLSLLNSLFYQLIGGLIFGGVGGLVSSFLSTKLRNHHPQILSQGMWKFMHTGVIVGLVDWLVGLRLAGAVSVLLDKPLGGLLHWRVGEPSKPLGILAGGLIGVLLCILVGGLTFGLLNGFSSRRLEKHLLVVPNHMHDTHSQYLSC